MARVAKKKNVHLCVNHNCLFESVFERARELAFTGALGEVVSVEARQVCDVRRNPGFIEEGAEHCHWVYKMNGGPLQDLMPHPASLIMEFIPEIKEVQSTGISRGRLPKSWPDEIRVLVKSDYVTGYISISLNERPETDTFTIKGTKGTVQADAFSNMLWVRLESPLPRAVSRALSGFQLTRQSLTGSLRNIYEFTRGRIDKSGGIAPVICKFYECIRNGGQSPVPLNKSLRVLDLIDRVWPTPAVNTHNRIKASYRSAEKRSVDSTVFVTGASGFIGTHLIKKLLSEKIGVRALVRPNSIHLGRLKNLDVDIVKGNLADAEVLYAATKGIKTIFHVAATSNNDWEEDYQVNIKGTEHLINAALANQVEKFVHISTLAIYGLDDVTNNSSIQEDSEYCRNPKRLGSYAYSKIKAEKLIFAAYRNHGLGVTVLRPGIVIGPMGRVFFPHLGYHYQNRLFVLTGNGNTILPLTYVENTVDGIYRASVEDNAIGQVYNLVDDGRITARNYVEQFIRTTAIDARVVSLPYFIPYVATTAYELAASLNFVKKGLTSREQLKRKHKSVCFDNTKAKNELGWQQSVSLQEGIEKTFEWYKSTITV